MRKSAQLTCLSVRKRQLYAAVRSAEYQLAKVVFISKTIVKFAVLEIRETYKISQKSITERNISMNSFSDQTYKKPSNLWTKNLVKLLHSIWRVFWRPNAAFLKVFYPLHLTTFFFLITVGPEAVTEIFLGNPYWLRKYVLFFNDASLSRNFEFLPL